MMINVVKTAIFSALLSLVFPVPLSVKSDDEDGGGSETGWGMGFLGTTCDGFRIDYWGEGWFCSCFWIKHNPDLHVESFYRSNFI